jgi:hypothetical protein
LSENEKRQLQLHMGWAKFETILKATPDVSGEGPNDPILRLRAAEIAWHKYNARPGVEINEKAASFGQPGWGLELHGNILNTFLTRT